MPRNFAHALYCPVTLALILTFYVFRTFDSAGFVGGGRGGLRARGGRVRGGRGWGCFLSLQYLI